MIKKLFKNTKIINNKLFEEEFEISPTKEGLITTVIYLFFGAMWIWFSDRILDLIVTDPELYRKIQTLKGWFYVAITGLLIYSIIKTRSIFLKNSLTKLKKTHSDLQRVHNNLIVAEEKLKNSIYRDNLTKLTTRIGLELEMNKLIEVDQPFAFLHINFDNFRYINDTLGHSSGDTFLKEMAEKIANFEEYKGSAGRIGGDEFGVILSNTYSLIDLREKIEDINKALGKKWVKDDTEFFVSTSIGISVFPKDGLSVNEIMRNADLAMNRAKVEGKGRGIFYTGEILESNSEKMIIAHQIHYGLEKSEFILFFQPQFSLDTGEISGLETLIRWDNPISGFVSPAVFIPIAEETGQIYQIEKWVLKNALKQKEIFEKKGYGHLDLSINLSSKTIMSNINFQELKNILDKVKVDYSTITLEVTETAIISDIDFAIKRLNELKAYGLKIALDDFGTGYSSLTYLKRLPIDIIKLDRSFVKSVADNGPDSYIIKSVLSLALDLKYEVVAEGIETIEQYSFLEKNKCSTGQGFLMSRPLPINEIYTKLIDKYKFSYQ